jgi:hypothetical protein
MTQAQIRSICTGIFSLWIACCLCPPQAAAGSPEQDIVSKYRDQTLMLRNSYCAEELSFDAQGKLLGDGEPGSFTLCSEIHIKDIEVSGSAVTLRAQRVYLYYDNEQHRFRDVMESHPRKEYKKFLKSQKVAIHVALPASLESADLQSVLDKVVAPLDAGFAEVASPMWKCFLMSPSDERCHVRQYRQSHSDKEQVLEHTGASVVSPRAVFAPEPDYSEAARLAKLSGGSKYWVVVDEKGNVADVQVVDPLGLGLDEESVEKLSTWKFVPGSKDGVPVPVILSVEVNFHLY